MKTVKYLLLLVLIACFLQACKKDKVFSTFEGTYEIVKIDTSCCYIDLVADTTSPNGYIEVVVGELDTLIDTIQISPIPDEKHTMLIKSFSGGKFEEVKGVLEDELLIMDFEEKIGIIERKLNGSLSLNQDEIMLRYTWSRVDTYHSQYIGASRSGIVTAKGVQIE